MNPLDHKELEKILRRHGIKEPARRFAIISDLLAAFSGRERVEFVVCAMAIERKIHPGQTMPVSVSEIAKRVGLSYRHTVKHIVAWHNDGGIIYEYGGPGRLSKITIRETRLYMNPGLTTASDKALRK